MSAVPETAFATYAELVVAVQRSRGWFRRIALECGCRPVTLRRMANDPGYDPAVSEIEKVRAWYLAHGVPQHHPLATAAGRSIS